MKWLPNNEKSLAYVTEVSQTELLYHYRASACVHMRVVQNYHSADRRNCLDMAGSAKSIAQMTNPNRHTVVNTDGSMYHKILQRHNYNTNLKSYNSC